MLKFLLEISLLLIGVLTITASVRNWQMLFEDGRNPSNAGRVSARILYGALGAIVTTVGLISVLKPLA